MEFSISTTREKAGEASSVVLITLSVLRTSATAPITETFRLGFVDSNSIHTDFF